MLVLLVLAAPAAARQQWTEVRHRSEATVAQSVCLAGVPTQTLTVVNQAHARASAVGAAELAAADQSVQLRAAWGTPCVEFQGGWPVKLTSGCTRAPDGSQACQLGGVHYGPSSAHGATAQPALYVQTGALPYTLWARAFTHERVRPAQPSRDVRWHGRSFQASYDQPNGYSNVNDSLGSECDEQAVTPASPGRRSCE